MLELEKAKVTNPISPFSTDLMRRRQHDFQATLPNYVPKSPVVGDVSKSAVARSYMADFPGNFLYRDPPPGVREIRHVYNVHHKYMMMVQPFTINSVTNFNNFCFFLMRHVSFNAPLVFTYYLVFICVP